MLHCHLQHTCQYEKGWQTFKICKELIHFDIFEKMSSVFVGISAFDILDLQDKSSVCNILISHASLAFAAHMAIHTVFFITNFKRLAKNVKSKQLASSHNFLPYWNFRQPATFQECHSSPDFAGEKRWRRSLRVSSSCDRPSQSIESQDSELGRNFQFFIFSFSKDIGTISNHIFLFNTCVKRLSAKTQVVLLAPVCLVPKQDIPVGSVWNNVSSSTGYSSPFD